MLNFYLHIKQRFSGCVGAWGSWERRCAFGYHVSLLQLKVKLLLLMLRDENWGKNPYNWQPEGRTMESTEETDIPGQNLRHDHQPSGLMSCLVWGEKPREVVVYCVSGSGVNVFCQFGVCLTCAYRELVSGWGELVWEGVNFLRLNCIRICTQLSLHLWFFSTYELGSGCGAAVEPTLV